MPLPIPLRYPAIATLIVTALLNQPLPACAGVSGNITGVVRATDGMPIAGVRVRAESPSMTRNAATDGSGHFVILALAPDTYAIQLNKAGYADASLPGVTVFADQTQIITYTMKKALRTIAHVISTGAGSLVQPSVGSDVYSVNATQIAAGAPLGGPGNLNSAYSAMAIVPGVQVSQGGMGWNFNVAYVRGQNYYYTGYEYDGVPVNRAFDNYNGSTEPSLGVQELQVYTAGAPPSVASYGTAGFINQVIKTGTFPGYATANVGTGAPAFYHQAQIELGGSTPDRTFSYYAGFMGYNQTYRLIDNSNGAGYATPGGIFSGTNEGWGSNQIYAVGSTCITSSTCQGVKPMCPLFGKELTFPAQGCLQFVSNTANNAQMVTDRESVINLHFGIPKRDGLRDDMQFLWSGSAQSTYGYDSPSDVGPGVNQFMWFLYNTKYAPPVCRNEPFATWGSAVVLAGYGCTSQGGSAQQIYAYLQPTQFFWQHVYGYGKGPFLCPAYWFACAPTYVSYADSISYNLLFGTPIATSPTNFRKPAVYFEPDTPSHPFNGPLPLYDDSVNVAQNDAGITKFQYTHALSQSAYLRIFAYTFYSDWLNTDPTIAATGYQVGGFPGIAQYILASHTSGGAINFEDQLNGTNLITAAGNYTASAVVRLNNLTAYGYSYVPIGTTSYQAIGSPIGYVAKVPGGYACFDPASGTAQTCLTGHYYDVATKSVVEPTWIGGAMTGPPNWPNAFAPAGSPAARAGATWDTLWNGNVTGAYNTVRPRFTNAALQDQYRPSDKLMINASLRYDDFTYDLPDSLTDATRFYANMLANYTCVMPATDVVLTLPLPPTVPPPTKTQYVKGDCDKAAAERNPDGPHKGWVHPNGTIQDGVQAPNFTASSPSSYTLTYWQPRLSGTYTINPNTVLRAAAGRFVQPPPSAVIQYLSASGDLTGVWGSGINLGFYSPFRPLPGLSAAQYDLSWEQHLRGTDMSFKLTPFYTWITNWQQYSFIGAGFTTVVPVGVNRNEGVEFQFQKGDLAHNGLSGLLAFTYTNSKIRFQSTPLSTGGVVPNELVDINLAIEQYNKLTKAGGGSPCYQINASGIGVGVGCSKRNGLYGDTILNPYYNKPPQDLLDTGGWYNPYQLEISPNLNNSLGSYISPYVGALMLNWRHNRLAITPSLNIQTGGFYGTPLDTDGVDPRTCPANSKTTGITKLSPKSNPLQCNYLYVTAPGVTTFAYLYVPNPQTGTFLFDNYEQPSSLFGNLQVSYDMTPRIRLQVLGTTLFHTCFGGTPAPWTAVYPPGNVICGYSPAGALYPSNFYNGTSIYDYKANGARTPYTQSYMPSTFNNAAVGGAVEPIQVYVNAQVKI